MSYKSIGVASDLLTAFCDLNCLAVSTTVPTMKKSIILVSALSVVLMALVSCATSDSDVDPARVPAETTTPYHEAAPAHDHIGGM